MIARALAALAVLAGVAAECPNACSGRGTCGVYDDCTCYSGFMANDCSERICPFGWAHVDGAKGDLNGDGTMDFITNPLPTVVSTSQMYSQGTQEGVYSSAANAAHWYMECSNKGFCDRATGTCQCLDAYEGHACQRASCPVVAGKTCSGHGVCMTVRELAYADYTNKYELWDADKGMSCKCDPGYSGYDCSERECPRGVDPLYKDETELEPRYPIWTFRLYGATLTFSSADTVTGSFRVKYYDEFGEDWLTDYVPIAATASATAASLQSALLALKNGAVPSAACTGAYTATSAEFTCALPLNFGAHRVPDVITMDENGASMLSLNSVPTGATGVAYDRGVLGEDTDFFTICDGVTVTQKDAAGTAPALIQKVSLDIVAVGGTFDLTMGTVGTAAGIAYNAADGAVVTAMTAGGTGVTGVSNPAARTFTFTTPTTLGGAVAAVNTNLVAISAADAGGITVTVTVGATGGTFTVAINTVTVTTTPAGGWTYVPGTAGVTALAATMQADIRAMGAALTGITTPATATVTGGGVAGYTAVFTITVAGGVTGATASSVSLAYGVTVTNGVASALAVGASPAANFKMGTLATTTSATMDTLLKACLGDADGSTANDLDAERWDYGENMPSDFQYDSAPVANAALRFVTHIHPHLVKLIDTKVGTGTDAPGTNAIVFRTYQDTADTSLRLMSLVGPTGALTVTDSTTAYYVATSNGYLTRVFDDVAAGTLATPTYVAANAKPALATVTQYSNVVTLDVASYSCDQDAIDDHTTHTLSAGTATSDDIACLSKGDLVVIPYTMKVAPQTIDMDAFNTAELRTIVKISGATLTLDRPLHYTDGSGTDGLPIYKFTRASGGAGEFDYVAPCAGRGLCSRSDGLCKCFGGYTAAACDTQSSLIA